MKTNRFAAAIAATLKKVGTLAAVATLTATALSPSPMQAENIKREVRGVWVGTAWCLDWPTDGNRGTTAAAATKQQNEAVDYLDYLKAQGINSVYFQVRPFADRLYKQTKYEHNGRTFAVYEPFSSYASGTRGSETTYDPLQFWIDEAHKRGMELYAWVNPYRYSTGATWTTSQDKAVASWLLTYEKNQIFNPALSNTKVRIENVCAVLTGNYDIDGLVFDDYFYPNGIPCNSTAGDYTDYTTYKNGGGTLSMADWRRENINDMVRRVNTLVHSIKPHVRFGISPAGIAGRGLKSGDGLPATSKYFTTTDWQYDGIYSDPVAWMREKSVDFVSPQIYWTTTASGHAFQDVSKWWGEAAQKFGRHYYGSHSLSFLQTSNTAANQQDVVKQVQYNRTNTLDGNCGSIMYSAASMTGKKAKGVGEALKASVYQYPAVAPAVTWYSATDPGTVTNLQNNGTTLSWNAIAGQRYLTYAIPANVKATDATSTSGGFRAEYIIDLTYTNSIAIPGDKRNGYWYAVAPFDRYGNEWTATTLGEPQDAPKALDAPQLLAPADGTVWGDADPLTFTVTTVANATDYMLELSCYDDFSNKFYADLPMWKDNHDGTMSATLGYSIINDPGTFFWRVVAQADGYTSGVSATGTFSLEFSNEYNIDPYSEYDFDPIDLGNGYRAIVRNLWMRNTDLNPLGIEGNNARSMAVRRAQGSQNTDMVFIAERINAGGTWTSVLHRYDANSGNELTSLNMTYDSNFKVGYQPANGILTDADGTLLTHGLAFASNEMSLAKVDPMTGKCTTVVTFKPGQRTDQLAVIGSVNSGTFYILAAHNVNNTQTQVSRFKVVNGTVTETLTATTARFYGAAPRVQPIDEKRFVIDGPAANPARYTMPTVSGRTISAEEELPAEVAPEDTNPTGSLAFSHCGYSFMVYAATGFAQGLQFGIHYGDDLTASFSGITRGAIVPNEPLGYNKPSSGDLAAIAATIQHNDDYNTYGIDSSDPTLIFLYSPGNGLAAYSLMVEKDPSTTGTDSLEAADDNESVYYTLDGVQVSGQSLTPGIYIRRTCAGRVTKQVIR